jgi:FKBP-type peptidyl-prolyl cis-trans isomerase FklB
MSQILKRSIAAILLSGVVFAAQAVPLENDQQKFSYALGAQFAKTVKMQQVEVDPAAFAAAIQDALSGAKMQLTDEQMQEALQKAREAAMEKKKKQAEENETKGKAFQEEYKKQTGVKALENGLLYKELQAGKGDVAGESAEVTVHYKGTLIDGSEFDSSYGRGQPATFSLGNVVPGFREALSRMNPGAKWEVVMPSQLAYGARGAGGKIGPNETLKFEIELISVQQAKEEPAAAPQGDKK